MSLEGIKDSLSWAQAMSLLCCHWEGGLCPRSHNEQAPCQFATEDPVIFLLPLEDCVKFRLKQMPCMTSALSHSRGSHMHDILVFTLRTPSRAVPVTVTVISLWAFPSESSGNGYCNLSPPSPLPSESFLCVTSKQVGFALTAEAGTHLRS